ncbi:MAG: NCS2 family permease [Lachnospiraceae bacterium]|nr:NCS2 family permease [Lachnospiraceae bacterium]
MEKLFKLKENGTDVRTEIIAGATTFVTMAYIIAINPNLLTGFDVGSPLWNSVFIATCLSAFLGTLFMALLANKPFAMAPGMGLNSFFAMVVANIVTLTGTTYTESFQAALCITLIEGILFLIVSLAGIREKIVKAIPRNIRLGISPAVGLMLMHIGFGSNAQIFDENGNAYFVMSDFFGALTPSILRDKMGNSYPVMVLTVITMLTGFFIIIVLAKKEIKGAVILGMFAASVIYWAGEALFLGINPFAPLTQASFIPPVDDMLATTFFKFNFPVFIKMGWFAVITVVITFAMIDMFDTLGSLVGAAHKAGLIDKDGNMPAMKEALTADALGTIVGSAVGTSTVTTFVESASGVMAGGRTGLTALTTGVLFLLSIFLSPIVSLIPPAATSPALIYVGILMLSLLKGINFDDISESAPIFIMLITMPISGSIGHGIGLALISYTFIKLLTGEFRDVPIPTFVLSIIFLIKFFVVF